MPLHEEYQITYSLNFYIMIWAAICRPPCANGGECVRPGYCSCRNGFHGDRCQLGSYSYTTNNHILCTYLCITCKIYQDIAYSYSYTLNFFYVTHAL